MKILFVAMLLSLIALQYRIWFGSGSVQEVWRLQEAVRVKSAEYQSLKNRNEALEAEVADLKGGLDAIEERARAELGMISEDESFYQFVRDRGRASTGTVVPRTSVAND